MYNTILVPIDVGYIEQSIQSLTKASKLIGDNEIIVLHVVEAVPEFMTKLANGISFDDNESGGIDSAHFDNTANATKELEALVEKSGVKARIEVRKGRSYDCIFESANENKVDLVIINSHQSDIQHFLLGSTAEKVVRHVPCAVLIER